MFGFVWLSRCSLILLLCSFFEGYGHTFYRAGLIDKESTKFDLMSATSGGAWFKQQFLYSQQFFNRIIEDDPNQVAEFALQWLGAFVAGTPPVTGPDDRCEQVTHAATINPQLGVCELFSPLEWDFAAFIQKMLSDTSIVYDDPGFAHRLVTPNNRVLAMRNTDFHVQFSLAANSRVDLNTSVFLGPANDPRLDYSLPLAAQYVVTGNENYYTYAVDDAELPFRTQTERAPATIDSADWVDYYLFPPPGDATEFSSTIRGDLPGGNTFREPFGAAPPTITQIAAAASSAFADISPSVPSMYAQSMSNIEFAIQLAPNRSDVERDIALDVISGAYNSIWETPLLDGFAICSQWPAECSNEDGRLIDGGFTDFLGVAQTIGQFQSNGDKTKTLKLIVTNNNNAVFGNVDFLAYFNTSFYQGIKPGDFFWPVDPMTGPYPAPRKSLQIFEEFMDDETLLGAFQPIEGTDLTSAIYEATTIDNPDFKVQAGMKVEILLLQINSDIPTFFDPTTIPDLQELTRTVASNDELVRRVQEFAIAGDSTDICDFYVIGAVICFFIDLLR